MRLVRAVPEPCRRARVFVGGFDEPGKRRPELGLFGQVSARLSEPAAGCGALAPLPERRALRRLRERWREDRCRRRRRTPPRTAPPTIASNGDDSRRSSMSVALPTSTTPRARARLSSRTRSLSLVTFLDSSARPCPAAPSAKPCSIVNRYAADQPLMISDDAGIPRAPFALRLAQGHSTCPWPAISEPDGSPKAERSMSPNGLPTVAHVLGKRERRLVRPAGLEPATPGLGNRCSILLSYGRDLDDLNLQNCEEILTGTWRGPPSSTSSMRHAMPNDFSPERSAFNTRSTVARAVPLQVDRGRSTRAAPVRSRVVHLGAVAAVFEVVALHLHGLRREFCRLCAPARNPGRGDPRQPHRGSTRGSRCRPRG